ncbi:hypothetical protein AGROH133_07227 [Agrobacterium tumefaciens]|nr:hypothetical protein AGROH133_07227 [Agrobacterium tumefaciens]
MEFRRSIRQSLSHGACLAAQLSPIFGAQDTKDRCVPAKTLSSLTISAMTILLSTLPLSAQSAGWKPAEQIKTYAISGDTGGALYQSIGERGPTAGVQAIAHTTFKLTWRRDYRPQPDGACVLATAKPNLTIIYTWPKAPARLPPAVAASWKTFISGVETHERVHGEHILDMVQKIETFSTGLRAENDPKCQKVRVVLQQRLGELSNEQRQRGRDFDRDELSPGGRVHQLILALVNGP